MTQYDGKFSVRQLWGRLDILFGDAFLLLRNNDILFGNAFLLLRNNDILFGNTLFQLRILCTKLLIFNEQFVISRFAFGVHLRRLQNASQRVKTCFDPFFAMRNVFAF